MATAGFTATANPALLKWCRKGDGPHHTCVRDLLDLLTTPTPAASSRKLVDMDIPTQPPRPAEPAQKVCKNRAIPDLLASAPCMYYTGPLLDVLPPPPGRLQRGHGIIYYTTV